MGLQLIQHSADFGFHIALHGDGHHANGAAGPALGAGAQQISQRRTGNTGEQCNAARLLGKRSLARWIEQPFFIKLLPHPLKALQHGGEAGADVDRLHAEAGAGGPEIELSHHTHPITVAGAEAQALQSGRPGNGLD